MIITDENKLRIKCEDVLPEEVDSLIKQLEEELTRSDEMGKPGIGLSAIQIGIPKRCAIVRIYNSNGPDLNINLVNCKISKTYGEFTFKNEGCLSFPGLSVDTKRYKEIVVEDNLVEPHRFIATGLLAVCIQHELDHLEGKLLIDWLPKNDKDIKGV